MSTQEYLGTFIILNQDEIDKLNQEERMKYEDSLKCYRDLKNVIDTAVKDKIREFVEKLLLKGSTFEFITEVTGLSIEEIQKIAD